MRVPSFKGRKTIVLFSSCNDFISWTAGNHAHAHALSPKWLYELCTCAALNAMVRAYQETKSSGLKVSKNLNGSPADDLPVFGDRCNANAGMGPRGKQTSLENYEQLGIPCINERIESHVTTVSRQRFTDALRDIPLVFTPSYISYRPWNRLHFNSGTCLPLFLPLFPRP